MTGVKKEEESLVHQSLVRFFKGGVSGLVSGALLQPLQVIKTSMQVSPVEKVEPIKSAKAKDHLSFSQATKLIYQREGMRGFLRGLTPSMMKNWLNAGTYFSLLFYSEEKLKNMGVFSAPQVSLISSSFARTIQSITSNPLIVIKTRLEVLGFQEYSGTMDAARQILAKEGAKGFFTGLGISLIRDVPFSGVFYPVYKVCRRVTEHVIQTNDQQHHHTKEFNKVLITSIASWMANVASCTITHPIDLIRTRVYFQYYNKNQAENYTGLPNAISKIYQKDGFFGFFRGLVPRILRKGMGSVVAWVIYEFLVDKKDAMIAS